TDQFADTVNFALTLTVYQPLVAPQAAASVTLHRTYTADNFYTPNNLLSAGNPPYTYAISAVVSDNSALTPSSFSIDSVSGALALNAAVASASTATVVIEVTDNSALPSTTTYSVIVALIDNALSFSESATTLTILTSANGNIGAVVADWTGDDLGAIAYRLGATTPATATANFVVNSETGALTLINALATMQTLSVEIIASGEEAPIGIDEASALVEVVALLPIDFDVSANPQAVTVTTTVPQNELLTVSATFAGEVTYSITDDNFQLTGDVIDLTANVATPTVITLEVVASEDLLSDSATLAVTVHFIDPAPLTLSATNIKSVFFSQEIDKVADLALAGGFLQAPYVVELLPQNAANNEYFTLAYSAGANAATLSLTAVISTADVLIATIALGDAHPNAAVTPPVVREITIEIFQQISAQYTPWFATLATGSQRAFGSVTILGGASVDVSYTPLDDLENRISINADGLVYLTAFINNAVVLTGRVQVDGVNSSNVAIPPIFFELTLALRSSNDFTENDQIALTGDSALLLTQVAGVRDVLVTSITASDGYVGANGSYQFSLLPADTQHFELNNISADSADLRINGTLLGDSTLTVTVRVTDLTPENNAEVELVLVVNDALQIGNTEGNLHYLAIPQNAARVISLTASGGVLPYTATISNVPAVVGVSLTLNGAVAELWVNDFVTNGTAGEAATVTVSLVGEQGNSATSAQTLSLINILTLPAAEKANILSGSVNFNLHTAIASAGIGVYNFTISTVPPTLEQALTLVVNENTAYVSVTSALAEAEYSVIIAVEDGHTQITQTITVAALASVYFVDTLVTINVPNVLNGQNLYVVQATGGLTPYTYALISQTASASSTISINATTGELTALGTAVAATIVAEVTDQFESKSRQTIVFSSDFMSQNFYINGTLFLIGGDSRNAQNGPITSHNDVWAFTGSTWQRLTADAGFAPRRNHRVVAYGGYLWLTGGNAAGDKNNDGNITIDDFDGNGFSDVWRSTDGITWQEVTDSAPFGARYDHVMVVHNNELLVIGGARGKDDYYNDVWSTNDGENWRDRGSFNGNQGGVRGMNASIVDDNLVLVGGRTGTGVGQYNQDIWQRTPTGSWSDIGHLAGPNSHGQLVNINDILYLFSAHQSGQFSNGFPFRKNLYRSTNSGQSWQTVKTYQDGETPWPYAEGSSGAGGGAAVLYQDRVYYIGSAAQILERDEFGDQLPDNRYYTTNDNLQTWQNSGALGFRRYLAQAVVFASDIDAPDNLTPALQLDSDAALSELKTTLTLPYAVATVTASGGLGNTYDYQLLGADAAQFSVEFTDSAFATIYLTNIAQGNSTLLFSLEVDDGNAETYYKENNNFALDITILQPLNFNPITSYVNISDQPSAVLLHSLTAQDGFAPYQYVIDSVLPASF
ncbi:MAG: hypothetical protein K0U15_06690, partial [Proteobacteria bacterium]|nr:hypothetical protein [Pseudomonadota bacterium]